MTANVTPLDLCRVAKLRLSAQRMSEYRNLCQAVCQGDGHRRRTDVLAIQFVMANSLKRLHLEFRNSGSEVLVRLNAAPTIVPY